MWRDAFNEIRLHPGRFVATLVAIVISVGFFAAISIMVATEQRGLAYGQHISLSKSDIVVTPNAYGDQGDAVEAVNDLPGVAKVTTDASHSLMLEANGATLWAVGYAVPDPAFAWAEVTEGRMPEADGELALSEDAANKLEIAVGDSVDDAIGGTGYTLVGVTNDPKSWATANGYVAMPTDGTYGAKVGVQVDGDVASTIQAIEQAVPDAEVQTTDDFMRAQLNQLTGDFDVFKYVLYTFAAIALFVGMIIISNTFTILVTQRRRQIALLRAVGASTGQVRRRLIAESLIIGVAGSLLGILFGMGVAAIGGSITGSLFFGLGLEVVDLVVAVALGVIVTLLSVLGPSLAATKVPPIEALSPVPLAAQEKRIGMFRKVVCGIFLGLGIFFIVIAQIPGGVRVAWAVAGCMCLSVTFLAGAPIYIAPILRFLGRTLGKSRPTIRLSAQNAARNPRRAAATSVALMLAVGLVITIQVGISTARSTSMALIEEQYPIDMILGVDEGDFPQERIDRVAALDSVKGVTPVETKEVTSDDYMSYTIVSVNEAVEQLELPEILHAPDGEGLVYPAEFIDVPDVLELPGVNGPVNLPLKQVSQVPYGQIYVSASTFEQIEGEASRSVVWVQMKDRSSTETMNDLVEIVGEGNVIDGAVLQASLIEKVVDVFMIVLTALLGVAVVIALVGVGNTLGLSVLERQRESALLRALGMQKRGLKLMLFTEAMLLAGVAVVIGLLGGAFFGWLGVSSVVGMANDSLDTSVPVKFSVDPVWTIGLIVVCVCAAALASVLPGRRAAKATPTEALAAE